ncbi:MAG: polysulfide reductase NrfD [Acidobacteriota bacterium]|jgi:anaerobic dimethyl sulfoxide reductase subunit C (anchor subunit)|nr:polysulfide reductase NrfD [Acidobacteriota bacterium]
MSIEWSLVFFTLFSGLAAGVFTGIAVSEWTGGGAKQVRFPGAVLTLAALVIGGGSSVLHLGHPERIFGALKQPGSSIFFEALLIGLFGLIVIFYLLALRRGASALVTRLLATLGAIPAVLLACTVGSTYMMPSRPAWDTLILPVLYLASAGVMGCFGIAALLSGRDESPAVPALSKITLMFLGIQAVLTAAYLVYLSVAPYPDVSRSAARVLIGDLAPIFWGGLVILGLLVPGFILLRVEKPGLLTKARYGLMCVLVAGIVFRAMMFSLGSAIHEFF